MSYLSLLWFIIIIIVFVIIFIYHFPCVSAEFHTSQSVAAQPIRKNPKRGYRQVVMVADKSQRQQDGRQKQASSHVHGNAKVRKETRPREESGGGDPERFEPGEHA